MVGLRESPSDSYSRLSPSTAICGTVGVAVEPLAPALAMEGPPLALGLREAIGDRIPAGRVHADAEVARLHLDALGLLLARLEAALPRDDAVGAAVDRGGRHGRRRAHVPHRLVVFQAMAAHELVEAPRVVGLGMPGEGAPERDHAAHVIGNELRDLAREHTAQAPAHEAHAPPARAPEPAHALE